MRGDPHLSFARGGRADFRGRNGRYYNFLSAPGLALNVKTENSTFTLHEGALTVEGSFITEVHLAAIVGGSRRKWANVSFWASELNEFNTGWHVVNGTCGAGAPFALGMGDARSCGELAIDVSFASVSLQIRNWTVVARGNHVYGHVAGPTHRIDLDLKARGNAPSTLPHGMLGQSFSTKGTRRGKIDLYPEKGRFRTSAMAEGAIEGTPAQYEVATPYATRFAFSRFGGSEVASLEEEPHMGPFDSFGDDA